MIADLVAVVILSMSLFLIVLAFGFAAWVVLRWVLEGE